jgi:hypothetical protein
VVGAEADQKRLVTEGAAAELADVQLAADPRAHTSQDLPPTE